MTMTMMKRPLAWMCAAGAMAVVAFTLWQGPARAQQDEQAPTTTAQREHAESLSAAFRAVAEHGSPSVVAIRTQSGGLAARGANRQADPRLQEQSEPQARGNGQGQRLPRGLEGRNPFEGTPFEDFFREEMPGFGRSPETPRGLPEAPRGRPQQRGLGSGFVIDASGIIMTNNHVIQGADEVIVKLGDGREYKAVEWFTDPDTDLAIVRIEGADGLKAVRFGSSESMQIGDWVVAVGSPFGLEKTVTAGIVSAKGRGLAAGQGVNFLQTDAAINPGNSGGPLFNLHGEVIGVNTAIASQTGTFNGVGFAIPSDTANWVAKQLTEHGKVRRAYLGVMIQDLTADLSAQFGLMPNSGVLISQVLEGSPANVAGLEPGDVVTHLAGKPVRNPRELQSVVHKLPFDEAQELRILRNGVEKSLKVTFKPQPSDLASWSGGQRKPATEDEAPAARGAAYERFGIEVGELAEALAEQLGYTGRQGVLITDIRPDSPAAAEGLDVGHLIERVRGQVVTSAEQFEEIVKQGQPDEGLLVLVRTATGARFVVLQP